MSRPVRRVPIARMLAVSATVALAVMSAVTFAPPLAAQQPTVPAAARADSVAAPLPQLTLAGVVRDTTGQPLAGAEIRAGAGLLAFSREDGTFTLPGVTRDTVQLLVRRIGYQPAAVTLAVTAASRVELAVKLVPAPVELGTIVIEGERMDTRLWKSGFYNRQRLGFGTFFTPEKLKDFGGTVGALMQEVPSVKVSYDRHNRATAYGRIGGDTCPLSVFLDGTMVSGIVEEVGLDQLVSKQDILAVEVYPRATEMPPYLAAYGPAVGGASGGIPQMRGVQLNSAGAADCGAIVIWTRPVGATSNAGR